VLLFIYLMDLPVDWIQCQPCWPFITGSGDVTPDIIVFIHQFPTCESWEFEVDHSCARTLTALLSYQQCAVTYCSLPSVCTNFTFSQDNDFHYVCSNWASMHMSGRMLLPTQMNSWVKPIWTSPDLFNFISYNPPSYHPK